MTLEYHAMKAGKLMFAFVKEMLRQLGDKKIEPNKKYTLQIEGSWLLHMIRANQVLYKKTKRLRLYSEGEP